MKTAAIITCTNRPKFAMLALESLDRQMADLDIYIVANGCDGQFLAQLKMLAIEMRKSVTLINLSARHRNIGVGVNCGLWHARHGSRDYDGYLKIDDDIVIEPDIVREMWDHCDGTNVVAVPPYAAGSDRYGKPSVIRESTIHDEHVSLYGACVLMPEAVILDLGYWGESKPRGCDTDFGVRAQVAGHRVTWHPERICLHLGHEIPTEGSDAEKQRGARMVIGTQTHRTTFWNDATTREAMIAERFGWAS